MIDVNMPLYVLAMFIGIAGYIHIWKRDGGLDKLDIVGGVVFVATPLINIAVACIMLIIIVDSAHIWWGDRYLE